MNSVENGFLLLTCQLGNPERKVLTVSQLRVLASRVSGAVVEKSEREMVPADLQTLGYGGEMAKRIVELLDEELLLKRYLRRGENNGCFPLTRATPGYPTAVRKKLGLDSPGCLWYKGNKELLQTPMIALAGSRELRCENRSFAREAGRQAAQQGFTLVSGNASGADREAQEACLTAGGRVICVVANELERQPDRDRVLYLSEDGFDLPFSPQRALSRNRVIHCLGEKAIIAQCALETGGTWDGTVRNLRFGWSPVFCFQDGSSAMLCLEQMGASLIALADLKNLDALCQKNISLFDQ